MRSRPPYSKPYLVYSLLTIPVQPDDGPVTRPKHVVFCSYVISCVNWLNIYIYIYYYLLLLFPALFASKSIGVLVHFVSRQIILNKSKESKEYSVIFKSFNMLDVKRWISFLSIIIQSCKKWIPEFYKRSIICQKIPLPYLGYKLHKLIS